MTQRSRVRSLLPTLNNLKVELKSIWWSGLYTIHTLSPTSSCVREHIRNNITIDTKFLNSLSFLDKRLFDIYQTILISCASWQIVILCFKIKEPKSSIHHFLILWSAWYIIFSSKMWCLFVVYDLYLLYLW
jgi:hypothetical protein